MSGLLQVDFDGGEIFPIVTLNGTLAARAVSGGSFASQAGNLVWDPAQTRHDNVYPTWDGVDGLAAAIAALQGQKDVTVANATLCNIPAGAWPGITDVTFIAGEGSPLEPQVSIADGATFPVAGTGFRLTLDGVDFVYNGNGSGVVTLNAGVVGVILLKNGAQIASTAAGRFLHVNDGFFFGVSTASSVWGLHTIKVDGTGAATADMEFFEGGALAANAIDGNAGTVSIAYDDASNSSVSQAQAFAAPGVILFLPAGAQPGVTGYNAGWYAALNIYWDPQAGNDGNTGLAVGSPVQTFAEITRRYGSSRPQFPYGVGVVIHQLSAQNVNTDPVFFAPLLSGGGQAVLLVSLTVKTAAFAGGAVTAKNQATGQRLTVAGFPAGTAAGDYVFNQTRNSYAFVDVGGATPVFSQPLPASLVTTPGVPTLAEDNTWANGDTYVVNTLNNTNLKLWRPQGGDFSGAGNATACCGWVQWADVADSSGAATSVLFHLNESGVNVLSGCILRSRCHMGSIGGRGFSVYLLGCDAKQAVLTFGSNNAIYGGITRGTVTTVSGNTLLDGGILMHGTIGGGGVVNFADVYWDSSILVDFGMVARLSVSTGGTAAMWGTGTVDVQATASFIRQTGASWVAVWLSSGAMTLDSAGTGSTYTGAGVMADGVTVTPAHIDAGGAGGAGIFNPRTGARYCNAP